MPSPKRPATTEEVVEEKVVAKTTGSDAPKEEVEDNKKVVEEIIQEDAKEEVIQTEAKEEDVAEEVNKKVKLYKVKFLENHEFSVGITKHNAKKGEVVQVELHLANLFASRKIAYMLG